jgi:hypothetical protein
MRSHADLESTSFFTAVVAAARAVVAGRDDDGEAALREAFDALSATRARYYPVDSYVIDLVLVAAATRGAALVAAIDSPVPVAVAASGESITEVFSAHPDAVAAVRAAVEAGRVELCSGPAADTPLDLATPESALHSFIRGREAFSALFNAPPASFARVAGGAIPLLPQLLAGCGVEGGIWTLFDGSPLPDVGGGMIRWQAGGAAIDLLAAAPLDARSARTVLALHETLGDALDREHVAAVLFAHYAGTASRWHALVRRIGRWTNLLGTFVTPRELARRTTGAGTTVSLEPDAFPPTLPRSTAAAGDDVITAASLALVRGADWGQPRCRPARPRARAHSRGGSPADRRPALAPPRPRRSQSALAATRRAHHADGGGWRRLGSG